MTIFSGHASSSSSSNSSSSSSSSSNNKDNGDNNDDWRWWYISFKIFRRFWLPPTLRLLLNNQLKLTIIIWKMWVTYHRWNCIFDWKRGCLGNCEQKNVTEIAEFFNTTERKKCKNMQNILLGRCCLLFEEYLQDKRSVYNLKPNRAEKKTKVLKKVYEEVSMLRS